jgi:hypothetical protein
MKVIKTASFEDDFVGPKKPIGRFNTEPDPKTQIVHNPKGPMPKAAVFKPSGDVLADLDECNPQQGVTVEKILGSYPDSSPQPIPTLDNTTDHWLFQAEGQQYVTDEHGFHEQAGEWIDSMADYELSNYVNERDFNAEFWKNPEQFTAGGFLYHGTEPDNIESIKTKGLMADSRTRGSRNNDGVDAVFTTANPQIHAVYGSAAIMVNVLAMKAAGHMPPVKLENGFDEKELKESLAHKLGLEDYFYEVESDLDPETIVFMGNIPPQFISIAPNT